MDERTAAQKQAAREALEHHMEWSAGWQYMHTTAFERDHPNGWDHLATRPEGWELNVDIQVGYDGQQRGHTLEAPGVIRNPNAASGPLLIAHWRRRR